MGEILTRPQYRLTLDPYVGLTDVVTRTVVRARTTTISRVSCEGVIDTEGRATAMSSSERLISSITYLK